MNREGENKPDWTLLLEDFGPALMEALRVIEFGASKHSTRDWMKHPPEQYKKAMMRHVMKGIDGVDTESGMLHGDHALVNLLMWRMRRRS